MWFLGTVENSVRVRIHTVTVQPDLTALGNAASTRYTPLEQGPHRSAQRHSKPTVFPCTHSAVHTCHSHGTTTTRARYRFRAYSSTLAVGAGQEARGFGEQLDGREVR